MVLCLALTEEKRRYNMDQTINLFITYLAQERRYSPKTIMAYQEDLKIYNELKE